MNARIRWWIEALGLGPTARRERRERKARQSRRAAPARLSVERLEERCMLSADPTIVVLTHGYQFAPFFDATPPDWVNTFEGDIRKDAPSNFEFVTHDWADVSDHFRSTERERAVDAILTEIEADVRRMKRDGAAQIDLLTIGHSRGAIVNPNYSLSHCTAFEGSDGERYGRAMAARSRERA